MSRVDSHNAEYAQLKDTGVLPFLEASQAAQEALNIAIRQLRDITSTEARQDMLARCSNQLLPTAHRALRELKIEMRILPSPQLEEFQREYRQQDAALRQIKLSLELSRAHAAGPPITPQAILEEASSIQSESLASVKRMQRTVAETKELADTTVQSLVQQRERFEVQVAKASAWQQELSRAEREVTRFTSSIPEDAITASLLLLIGLALAFLLVWLASSPDADMLPMRAPTRLLGPLDERDTLR